MLVKRTSCLFIQILFVFGSYFAHPIFFYFNIDSKHFIFVPPPLWGCLQEWPYQSDMVTIVLEAPFVYVRHVNNASGKVTLAAETTFAEIIFFAIYNTLANKIKHFVHNRLICNEQRSNGQIIQFTANSFPLEFATLPSLATL